jgi:hypothetical protein
LRQSWWFWRSARTTGLPIVYATYNQSSMQAKLFSFNLNPCNGIGKTGCCFPLHLPPPSHYFEIHLWNQIYWIFLHI